MQNNNKNAALKNMAFVVFYFNRNIKTFYVCRIEYRRKRFYQ